MNDVRVLESRNTFKVLNLRKNSGKYKMRIIETILKYSKTEKLKIDDGVLPLVKVLNNWEIHPDWHFSGLATTFSCEGHKRSVAYVSFHSSRLIAQSLAECLKKYENKDKWNIEFTSNGNILRARNKNVNYLGEIKELANFLEFNFSIPKNDLGWRAFPLPRHPEVYGFSEVFSERDGEEMIMSMLDYIISNNNEMDKNVLAKSMKFKFGEWQDTYDYLMKYGLVEVNGSKVSTTLDIKEGLWQMVVRKIEADKKSS